MATIYQVSERAGVSLATVSRVINNNAKVSEKTRKKVEAAMAELGYRPNASARSLASNRSDSVGVMVSELNGPFYGPMMSTIEHTLRSANKHVIIAAGHSNEEAEKAGIEFLISRNCDALILHVEAVSDEFLLELSKGDTPIFLINRYLPQLSEACVSLNNEKGGYLAAQALIEAGHTKLAYISGPLWKNDAKDRLKGHQRALQDAGIAFNNALLYKGDYQESGGTQGIVELLEKTDDFTALVCANDEMAAGAMAKARELKLKLPAQLSIVGFDDIVFARYLWPRLTTVQYPIDEMGNMAARLVLKNVYRVQDDKIYNQFDPVTIYRDSVHTLSS